jgi:hypothetical protein
MCVHVLENKCDVDPAHFTSAADVPQFMHKMRQFFLKNSLVVFSSYHTLSPCSPIIEYGMSVYRDRKFTCESRKKYNNNRQQVTHACKELVELCRKNGVFIRAEIKTWSDGSLCVKVECECLKIIEIL